MPKYHKDDLVRSAIRSRMVVAGCEKSVSDAYANLNLVTYTTSYRDIASCAKTLADVAMDLYIAAERASYHETLAKSLKRLK